MRCEAGGCFVMRLRVPLNGSDTSLIRPFRRFQRLYQRGAGRPSTEAGYNLLPDLFDFLSGNRRLIRQQLTFCAIHDGEKLITPTPYARADATTINRNRSGYRPLPGQLAATGGVLWYFSDFWRERRNSGDDYFDAS